MLKSIMMGCAALSIFAMSPREASAGGVGVDFYFGSPGYFRDRDRDFYDRRYYRDRWDRRGNARISCNQARRIVRNNGYRNVSARECNGSTYTFSATRRGGDRVRVYVNARTGAFWRG